MKDYTDFDMTGLPDSPVIRKAHALLVRTIQRQFDSEGTEAIDFGSQNPDADPEIADSATMHFKAAMPGLAGVILQSAVETARLVHANSAMDSDDLVAAALLLDCVEDEAAIDDLIETMDEAAGIPILELDQIAQDTDNPLDDLEHLSDAAKLLVYASAIQDMVEMNTEFSYRANGGDRSEDGEWGRSIDKAGEYVADMDDVRTKLGGIDAGLDHAFETARSELAEYVLEDNRKVFAEARNQIKKAAEALKR